MHFKLMTVCCMVVSLPEDVGLLPFVKEINRFIIIFEQMNSEAWLPDAVSCISHADVMFHNTVH